MTVAYCMEINMMELLPESESTSFFIYCEIETTFSFIEGFEMKKKWNQNDEINREILKKVKNIHHWYRTSYLIEKLNGFSSSCLKKVFSFVQRNKINYFQN